MSTKSIWYISLLLVMFVYVSDAQETCETIVQQAIETASENCDGLRRNEACYGNVTIDAEAAPDVQDFTFETAGDIANVSDIASMRLSSRVEESGDWGISIMQVPVIVGENTETAQFVLFGDVELSTTNDFSGEPDETPTPEPVTIELTSTGNLNVRGGPSTNDAVVGTLNNGQVITAIARNETGDWVQFIQEDGNIGWVFVSLMTTDSDVSTLLVTSADDSLETAQVVEESDFGTSQSFYIRTGVEDRPCEEAPDSGVLIQTPEGIGQLTIAINEVQIQLGSTAYIRFVDHSELELNLIEGYALITAQDQQVVAPTGMFVTVPIDANGLASDVPSNAQPYDIERLGNLPLSLLSDQVSVADLSNSSDAPVILGMRPIFNGFPPRGRFCDWFLAIDFYDLNGDASRIVGTLTLNGSDGSTQTRTEDGMSIQLLPPQRVEGEPPLISPESQRVGATSWGPFQGSYTSLDVNLTIIDRAGNTSEAFLGRVNNPPNCPDS